MRCSIGLLIFISLVMASGFCLAQKSELETAGGQVGIFNSQNEYYEFIGSVKRVAYGPGGSAELQAMVPILNDIALNRPIGWTAGNYETNGTALGLLANKDVREEIEMVDEQYEELQKMRDELQAKAARQVLALGDLDPKDLQERLRTIVENTQNGLDSLLLPHQLDRLRQLHVRQKLKRHSLVDLLTSDPLKSELDISSEQARKLRKAEKEIEQELEREMQRLREKARRKLLSKLNGKQKEQVEKLIGEAPANPIRTSSTKRSNKKSKNK